MGENAQQIEQEIEGTRQELGRNLDELESRARRLADWRTHYDKHPHLFLGTAFAVGMVAGLVAVPRSGPRPTTRAIAHYEPLASHEPRFAAFARSTDRAKHQLTNTWEQIAEALLSLASAKVVDIVAGYVPGFREHLHGRPAHDNPYSPPTTH